MTVPSSLGEMLLGIEGMALLRLSASSDLTARRARVDEIRDLLQRVDAAELTDAAEGTEYDLSDGYRLWSETYEGPLRLFPLEAPVMHRLFVSLAPSVVLDAPCGTGRHSASLAERGHWIIGVELSREMLDRARAKVPAGDFLEGSLTPLPLGPDSVDAAICARAVVHLPDVSDVAPWRRY
jgi:SAM-dependent methyltransferase